MTDLKKVACECIDQCTSDLGKLSKSIWENPELAFKEYHAHDVITDFIEKKGLNVSRKYKLDTAFYSEFSPVTDSEVQGPNIAVLCEYDALPGIGHACGHNLIAEIGVATSLGIKAALSAADKKLGKLTVIGTPAEEGHCGKQDLINAGAFNGIDVAMMAHPSQYTVARPKYVSMIPVTIIYRGLSAHASSFPWKGLNALDAAVMCYNSISCLRQQMMPTWRAHGVIRRGGLQPNVIPDETELEYYLRTPSESELELLKEKVVNCINGAALCTSCEVEYKFGEKHYMSLLSNNTMATLFEENGKSIGIEFDQRPEILQKFGGSTDMGNVSHVVPSIHPKFFIGTDASNHSKQFTVASGTQEAQRYSLEIAKSLAMTAIDIYTNPEILPKIKKDFVKDTDGQ